MEDRTAEKHPDMSPRVREIPHDGPRVETGPTRIGDDWTGVFIRGDDALMGFLGAVLRAERAAKEADPVDLNAAWDKRVLGQLAALLGSASERPEVAPSP